MSIKIESDLRSFEKNKFEFRFVFTVKLPATAEKKLTVRQFYTYFSFLFHETEKTKKLDKSENSGHCYIIRKRIPVKGITNV